MKFYARSQVYIAVAAGLLSVAALPSMLAAQADSAVDRAEAQAHKAWRGVMHQISPSDTGCFHASYPSTRWEKVECDDAPAYRSARPNITQTLGNAYDFVAQAPAGHLFSAAQGEFLAASDLKSEKGVNVPFGGGESNGITGPNEYTLQLNTDIAYTAACGAYADCFAWQQYVMSSNTPSLTTGKTNKKTQAFIEYWLFNYGASASASCPAGFLNAGPGETGVDCVNNSKAVTVYNGVLPITNLTKLEFEGTATKNGTDYATVYYDGDAYAASTKDSYTDISTEWFEAEFNVVGNAGGSRADFNTGVSITVAIVVDDGSTSAPTCISPSKDDGTTGETNNLNPGTCIAEGGDLDYIEFVESN
jgi:hypothetical protein